MNIFIIHYKKLIERKRYLVIELSKYNFNLNFIDEFDRTTIDIDKMLIPYNKKMWLEKTQNLYLNVEIPERELKLSEICNSLSHLKAFEMIASSDDEYGIILEDDVILPDNFDKQIDNVIKNTPNDFEFIFLGSSFSLSVLDNATKTKSIQINDVIYKKEPFGTTRTVDAFVIKKEAAKKMLNSITEITLPFDFELNYFLRKLNTIVYWCEPGLVYQGSQSGVYQSSIR